MRHGVRWALFAWNCRRLNGRLARTCRCRVRTGRREGPGRPCVVWLPHCPAGAPSALEAQPSGCAARRRPERTPRGRIDAGHVRLRGQEAESGEERRSVGPPRLRPSAQACSFPRMQGDLRPILASRVPGPRAGRPVAAGRCLRDRPGSLSAPERSVLRWSVPRADGRGGRGPALRARLGGAGRGAGSPASPVRVGAGSLRARRGDRAGTGEGCGLCRGLGPLLRRAGEGRWRAGRSDPVRPRHLPRRRRAGPGGRTWLLQPEVQGRVLQGHPQALGHLPGGHQEEEVEGEAVRGHSVRHRRPGWGASLAHHLDRDGGVVGVRRNGPPSVAWVHHGLHSPSDGLPVPALGRRGAAGGLLLLVGVAAARPGEPRPFGWNRRGAAGPDSGPALRAVRARRDHEPGRHPHTRVVPRHGYLEGVRKRPGVLPQHAGVVLPAPDDCRVWLAGEPPPGCVQIGPRMVTWMGPPRNLEGRASSGWVPSGPVRSLRRMGHRVERLQLPSGRSRR